MCENSIPGKWSTLLWERELNIVCVLNPLVLVNIRGPKMRGHHLLNSGLCNILWNSPPLSFLIFSEYTPLLILHHWQHETHPKSLTVFYSNQGHGQHRHSLGIRERERGGLLLACREPLCQVKEAPILLAHGALARVHDLGGMEGVPIHLLSWVPLCRTPGTAWSLESGRVCFHICWLWPWASYFTLSQPQFSHLIIMPISCCLKG